MERARIKRSERMKPLIRGVVKSGYCPCNFRTLFLGLIDLRATGYGLGELGKVLEATEVIGHNIKFDADSFQRRFETGQ